MSNNWTTRAVALIALSALSVACGAHSAPEHPSAQPMTAPFASWLSDHTAHYVTITDVSCPDLSNKATEILCQFTGTIAPHTKIPDDNGLGLPPQSDDPVYLHDFTCTVQVDDAHSIDLVRCPTSIGWIFVRPKKPSPTV